MQTLHDSGSSHYFCIDRYDFSLRLVWLITLDYTPRKGLSDEKNLFIKNKCQERLWMELCGIAVNLRMLDDEHERINEDQMLKRLRLKEFKCGKILFTKNQQLPLKKAVDKGIFSDDVPEDERRRRHSSLTKGFIKSKKERRDLDLRVACNKIIHSTEFRMKKNKIIVVSDEQKKSGEKCFYEESIAEIDILQFVNESLNFLMPDIEIYKEKTKNLYSNNRKKGK